jgi:hypothetical protein
MNGTIIPGEHKSEVEVWIQGYGKDLFKNIKSGETLTSEELKGRKIALGSTRLIMVEFVKTRNI